MEIGKVISRAFDLYFKNFAVLFVGMILAYLVGGITFGILMGPMLAGLVFVCLKVLRGEKAEIGEVFSRFDKFVPTLILLILSGVVMGVLFAICLIPVIGWLVGLVAWPAIGAMVVFSVCGIVDKNLDFSAAVKGAIDIVKAKPVEIWLLALILGVISGICAIITAPIGILGLVMIYHEGPGVPAQTGVTA
ncbi:MAG: hypothetical protein ACM3X6_08035 [Patescibacteria group bacterium]